jgi:hypothetical protein
VLAAQEAQQLDLLGAGDDLVGARLRDAGLGHLLEQLVGREAERLRQLLH